MLREETVEPGTLGLLKKLVLMPELKDFRLVGGTALSLLYGHRKSIDLDLFTDKPLEKELLISALEDTFFKITTFNPNRKHIYQCIIQNVKVDFVCVRDAFLNPVQIIDNIPFAHTKDLIALKLNAVKGRGAKKDFWDVAMLLQIYSLRDLFVFYHERYSYDDTFAVIRSISYFVDAESDQDPESLNGMTWTTVKNVIKKALYDYYR
jgi:hypothetical protein